MPQFRKKPVVIEAVQFTRAMAEGYIFDKAPLPDGVQIVRSNSHPPTRKVHDYKAVIRTLEGDMEVSEDDWVITDVKGERYPCKPDIFAATYEAVVEPDAPLIAIHC